MKTKVFLQLNVIVLRCVELYSSLIATGNNHSHVTVASSRFFIFGLCHQQQKNTLKKMFLVVRLILALSGFVNQTLADRRGNCQNKIKSDSIHVS